MALLLFQPEKLMRLLMAGLVTFVTLMLTTWCRAHQNRPKLVATICNDIEGYEVTLTKPVMCLRLFLPGPSAAS